MAKIREPWHSPPYEKRDVAAIQALARYALEAEHPSPPGQAAPAPSPDQVKRALDWIVYVAAGTYNEQFRPGQGDVIAYLLGRRSVGREIVKLTKLNIKKVFRGEDDFSEHG